MKRAALIVCTAVAAFAWSNEGSVDYIGGGAVKLMNSHRTVTMVSEIVRIKVPERTVTAKFVFKNEGPACTVLMGFPESSGGSGKFTYFRSAVDGKQVEVKRVPAQKGDPNFSAWWTKRVPFARGQTRVVESRYKEHVTGVPDSELGIEYVLNTGASWKGKIGGPRSYATFVGSRRSQSRALSQTDSSGSTARSSGRSATSSRRRMTTCGLDGRTDSGTCL